MPNTMKKNAFAITGVLCSFVLLFSACQTADQGSVKDQDQEQEQDISQEEEWKQRMKRAGELREASQAKVNQLVENARTQMQNGEYEKAKEDLQQAVALDPGHDKASDLLRKVLVQLGELERGSGEELLDKWEAVKDQQKLNAERAFQSGKTAYENENYEKAVNKFEEAMGRLKYMPEDSPELDDLENKTKQFLADAKEKRKGKQEERRLREQRAMQRMAEKEEFERQQSRKQRVKEILERARELFEKKKYEEVETLLEEAEKIDPSVDQIEKLKRIAWRMRHRKTRRELAQRSKREYRETMRKIQDQMIGQSKIVKYPDDKTWEKIRNREPKGIRRDKAERKECEEEIISELRNTQISVSFQDSSLIEVINFFRDQVGINIIVDRQNLDPQSDQLNVTVNLDKLSAFRGLKTILGIKNLAFDFRECVLMITTQQAESESVFEIYQVKDLNFRLRNFPAADFNLSGKDDEGQGGEGGGVGTGSGLMTGAPEEAEEAKTAFSGEQLVQLIQQVVAPQSWGGQTQVTVQDGLLLVRNRPEVHDEILRLLESIRRSTGIIVTVESRFLEIRSTLLEQIGVEFSDLAGAPGPGPSTQPGPNFNEFSVDESVGEEFLVARDRNGNGIIDRGDLTSGIFEGGDDGGRNVSGRTSHSFDSIQTQAFQSEGINDLLDNEGANFEVSVLNDISVNAIVNAVKKDGRSRQVVAPQLTLFNTQRGNVTVARQIAYIQDVSPQTAADSVTPDPEIGVVNDNGFILDVRPIVSADRRYITLELRPTISDLVGSPDEIRSFDVVIGSVVTDGFGGGGGGENTRTATLEFPEVEQKRVRTTVAIPDGGTMMVGGLTSVTDSKRTSEIPGLSNIPVVGFLGSKDEDLEDHFQLVILVTANITIMEEVEQRRFSATVDLGE